MFPLDQFVIDQIIFIAVFPVFVVGTLLWKPRIWLHDFPRDIQDRAAPKAAEEKRLTRYGFLKGCVIGLVFAAIVASLATLLA